MESVRVGCVGVGQGFGSAVQDRRGGAVVDGGGGVQADARVLVHRVVVGEELLAEGAGVGRRGFRSGATSSDPLRLRGASTEPYSRPAPQLFGLLWDFVWIFLQT